MTFQLFASDKRFFHKVKGRSPYGKSLFFNCVEVLVFIFLHPSLYIFHSIAHSGYSSSSSHPTHGAYNGHQHQHPHTGPLGPHSASSGNPSVAGGSGPPGGAAASAPPLVLPPAHQGYGPLPSHGPGEHYHMHAAFSP